jgi:hypothetical protein
MTKTVLMFVTLNAKKISFVKSEFHHHSVQLCVFLLTHAEKASVVETQSSHKLCG